MKQKLTELKIQRETAKSKTEVGDSNTVLSEVDRTTGGKIRKDVQELNCPIDQQNRTNIFRALLSVPAEYAFFPTPTTPRQESRSQVQQDWNHRPCSPTMMESS